jgi:hypothetical protein
MLRLSHLICAAALTLLPRAAHADEPVIDLVANPDRMQGIVLPRLVDAVSKPAKGDGIAAREKIVADLAYLLGLPVPPVTLWNTGGGTYAAVSAWAFEKPSTWGHVKGSFPGAAAAALVPAMSAMLPFEAWIDAQDRHNDGNVLLTVASSGEPLAAWIDYAFSLDYVWNGNLVNACALPQQYPPFGNPDPAVMREVAGKIAAVKDEEIERLVKRIPEDCLPKDVAGAICSNLSARRSVVRGLC